MRKSAIKWRPIFWLGGGDAGGIAFHACTRSRPHRQYFLGGRLQRYSRHVDLQCLKIRSRGLLGGPRCRGRSSRHPSHHRRTRCFSHAMGLEPVRSCARPVSSKTMRRPPAWSAPGHAKMDGHQENDPAKGALAIIAAVDSPHPPLRLPLGARFGSYLKDKLARDDPRAGGVGIRVGQHAIRFSPPPSGKSAPRSMYSILSLNCSASTTPSFRVACATWGGRQPAAAVANAGGLGFFFRTHIPFDRRTAS